MDQSAEQVAALDVAAAWLGVRTCRVGREQRESAVWALAVVVGGVDAEHCLEVAASDYQQPVETLGTDGADEGMEPLWSPVVATGGKRRQMLPWIATGCLRSSMVGRASAVGCHPLREVPSL